MRDEIVIISRSLPMHGLGGMEVVAWDVAKSLHLQECKVKVITTHTGRYKGLHKIDGIDVYFIENVKSGKYSSKWWLKSRDYFQRNHQQSCKTVLSVSTGAYGLLPLKDNKIKFVIQVHGTALGEFNSKIKTRTLKSILTSPKNLYWFLKDFVNYPKFDSVIAIGEGVYKDLISKPYSKFVSSDNVKLISNGIDSDLFNSKNKNLVDIRQKYNIHENTKVLLTACRLHPQKGVENGIRLFNEISPKENCHYYIAGDGPDKERLLKLCDELKLKDKVTFLGSLTHQELADFLSISHAFIFLTNRIEGLPLNTLEAASVGVPILLSKHVNLFSSEHIYLVDQINNESNVGILNRLLSTDIADRQSYIPEEFTLTYSGKKYKKLLD
ncbi:glycosyltransferase family 4 protein [Biostraticola tofi]|uniref:Glycosyltransferase involved in cell wall biosynthesis n=1 Tax=Biostraticola tofi TaxID=466109 RepID=A0A4R3Z827_9GAMM|nr:glycosyltransferase family 4 protein [Biostraticola tofi]TCW00210.1 glycosyltransferase involved in cell wall biosynthesis [Biostraticola tofi]